MNQEHHNESQEKGGLGQLIVGIVLLFIASLFGLVGTSSPTEEVK